MIRDLKKVWSIAVLAICCGLGSSTAHGYTNYRKELGIKSCKDCHDAKDLKAKTKLPLYIRSVEMIRDMEKGQGDFEAKTSCFDCHRGSKLGG